MCLVLLVNAWASVLHEAEGINIVHIFWNSQYHPRRCVMKNDSIKALNWDWKCRNFPIVMLTRYDIITWRSEESPRVLASESPKCPNTTLLVLANIAQVCP